MTKIYVAEPVLNGQGFVQIHFAAGSAAAWLTPAEMRQLAQDLVSKADAIDAAVTA